MKVNVVTLVVSEDGENVLLQFRPKLLSDKDNVLDELRKNTAEVSYEVMRFFLNDSNRRLASLQTSLKESEDE